MNLHQVVKVYRLLQEAGIETWLQGGWGIDALLGRQTRDHKDLDLLIEVDHVARLLRLLDSHGFVFKYTWEENRWVVEDGERVPTAFVVGHDDGCELDFHAGRFGGDDVVLPSWSSERALSLAEAWVCSMEYQSAATRWRRNFACMLGTICPPIRRRM